MSNFRLNLSKRIIGIYKTMRHVLQINCTLSENITINTYVVYIYKQPIYLFSEIKDRVRE